MMKQIATHYSYNIVNSCADEPRLLISLFQIMYRRHCDRLDSEPRTRREKYIVLLLVTVSLVPFPWAYFVAPVF